MTFTRRPCLIGGQVKPNDWVIRYRKHDIGRMTLKLTPRGEPPIWAWSLWTYPARNGNADTEADALAAIKDAVLGMGLPVKMSGHRSDIT